MKRAVLVAIVVGFAGAQMFAPTTSLADVLKCKIDGYSEDVFITTSPDTNSSDGQYARIGISRGIGNRAIVVADRMGATAFVEPITNDTPIGLLTVQKDMRVIKSRQSIDPPAWCSRHPRMRACVPDYAELTRNDAA
jgi:hypothetical protein